MKKIIYIIVAVLFCSSAISVVYADNINITPVDTVTLNEIVVTATRNPTIKRLAPSLINVLPHEVFNDVGASCLVQGLSFVPGVRVENNCQNCGWTQARINGLDGHYSQILVDSRPLFSALTSIYGLEQLPVNMIDHVEIMRGGGSALFGSSAIGGTINIITKEPQDNGAELQHTITKIGSGNTFENNTTLNASVVSNNHNAGLYIYGASRNRQPYDADNDGFTELNKIITKSIGAHAIFKPSEYTKISIDYHNINDFRRGGNKIDLPPHDADLAETTRHETNGGGIDIDWMSHQYSDKVKTYFSFQNTDRDSYYGADKSLLNYGLTHNLTYVFGAQYVHNFNTLLFMPASATFGSEYQSDKINDESVGYKIFTNQHTRIKSFFAQNEWKDNRWSILAGFRMDKHNLIDHIIFSPRINFRYTPSDAWNFRASVSTGFRAPQAYDEDLHVDLVNGNRRVIRLADNLKEERSISWSGSANYHHKFGRLVTDFILEAFYTNLHNPFAFRSLKEKTTDGDEITERYNSIGAQVYGVNCELQAAYSSFLEFQTGFTLQKSNYKEKLQWSDDDNVPFEKRLFRTPDAYGYVRMEIMPVKRFSASITGNYTGSMLVQHKVGSGTDIDIAVNTKQFFEANLKLTYDISLFDNATLMQVSLGALNIFNSYQNDFDKGKERDSNYIYGPMMPRSIYAGVRFVF
ncbi:MAG: TonB-dependent receptor [Parabacteroides sp.]